MRRCLASLLALALGAGAHAANAPDILAHGRFTQVAVYRPPREVKQFVLLLSGPPGARINLPDVALALAQQGAMVATINTPELLASLERDPASALTHYGRKILATEILVTRGRGRRGTLRKLIELLTDVDVHVLPTPHADMAA